MKHLFNKLSKFKITLPVALIVTCGILYAYMAFWIIYLIFDGLDPFHAFVAYFTLGIPLSFPALTLLLLSALLLLVVAKKKSDRIIAIALGIFPFVILYFLISFVGLPSLIEITVPLLRLKKF